MEDRLESALMEILSEVEETGFLAPGWVEENYPVDGEELLGILALDGILRPPELDVNQLGPYAIRREIGRGGMGTVYVADVEDLAADAEMDAVVAVKVIHPHLLVEPHALKRFYREAAIGMRVRHPNVVPTYDVCGAESDGNDVHFLVMAYEEGRTLRSALASDGPLDEASCRRIGVQAAAALAAIHDTGAVHRDVKPANLILRDDGVVKVMDLGVALDQGDVRRLTATGRFVGSWRYAAPEQFAPTETRANGDDAVDERSDLYALGLTLFELATGCHPFEDDRRPGRPPDPSAVAPAADSIRRELSPTFVDVIAQMLQPERRDRIASAQAVIGALA